jgi:CDP-glucose 4,6-dehydratase
MESMGLKLANPEPRFWRDKRVLITGHTGFKGGWLALWLRDLGARVTGISLPPATVPSLFVAARVDEVTDSHFCDIRDAVGVASLIRMAEPEIVFHLAAQPLVRASYEDPLGTFSTNVQGTANTLEALRQVTGLRVVVLVTTDKVYWNREHVYPYREDDVLGGHDPYSASKAAAELVAASYRDSFLAERGVGVATARAGNVVGGGDWSADRLIPDAIRAWSGGGTLFVRRPAAVRPWQHVLEPLAGYLRLSETLWDNPRLAGAYNFGPHPHEAATVREVITRVRPVFGKGRIEWSEGTEGPHEAGRLTLETAKARSTLGVSPRWSLATTIDRTAQWYRHHAEGENARSLCDGDLAAFIDDAA